MFKPHTSPRLTFEPCILGQTEQAELRQWKNTANGRERGRGCPKSSPLSCLPNGKHQHASQSTQPNPYSTWQNVNEIQGGPTNAWRRKRPILKAKIITRCQSRNDQKLRSLGKDGKTANYGQRSKDKNTGNVKKRRDS